MRDLDVRTELHKSLLLEHHAEPDTRVIDEMGVWCGTARIDIAVLNGEMAGYEIKSDRDSLDRLPHQIEIYSKVFDKLTLVVGKKHAKKAAQVVPKWWGLTIATMEGDTVSLSPRRSAKQNRIIDPAVLSQQLWKEEVIQIIDRYDTARGWRAKNRRQVFDRLIEVVPEKLLRDEVRETLKARVGWLRK